ncbi:MAG: hypothetical protein ACOC6C_05805 [Verrucomicrobiota bacterium]
MKLFRKIFPPLFLAVVAITVSIAAGDLETRGGTGRKVRLPLEFDEKGNLRSQLFAGSMSTEEGLIKATEVKVEFYGPAGAVQMVMQLEKCVFDKARGKMDSKSDVSFRRGNSVITGTGLKWERGEKTVKILSDVRVQLAGGFEGFRHLAQVGTGEAQEDE